jgi:hypothetical protein
MLPTGVFQPTTTNTLVQTEWVVLDTGPTDCLGSCIRNLYYQFLNKPVWWIDLSVQIQLLLNEDLMDVSD